MERRIIIVLSILSMHLYVIGQSENNVSGRVSYITSQHIYLKFESTDGLKPNDTIYMYQNGKVLPVLVVSQTSSISAVCLKINEVSLFKDQEVFFLNKKDLKIEEALSSAIIPTDETLKTEAAISTMPTEQKEAEKLDSEVSGKLSVSSYSNFSSERPLNQRFRYTAAVNVDHISKSNFSFESYLSFNHSNQNWDQIKADVFYGLKTYAFALKYENAKGVKLYAGRKMNPNLSSIGAIDGLQFEKQLGSFIVGSFVGSRPDYRNYSFNLNLFQAGVYASHQYKNAENGLMRNNIAVVEQKNNWNTDRRFLYFQHYQSLIENLSIFASIELDLYKRINGVSKNDLQLTNLQLLIRYRILKNLSVSLSYSSRNNIIYYETYKSFLDRLLEQSTSNAYRLSVNYRLLNKISIGIRASYRSQKTDIEPSINLNGYVSYINIPFIKASSTISATLLQTGYVSGNIYSLNLSKELYKRVVFASLNYRYVNYTYTFSDMKTTQHIPEIRFNWRIMKNLRASVAFESIFEDKYRYQRLYFNLIKRF